MIRSVGDEPYCAATAGRQREKDGYFEKNVDDGMGWWERESEEEESERERRGNPCAVSVCMSG